jgi:hypothetical protein
MDNPASLNVFQQIWYGNPLYVGLFERRQQKTILNNNCNFFQICALKLNGMYMIFNVFIALKIILWNLLSCSEVELINFYLLSVTLCQYSRLGCFWNPLRPVKVFQTTPVVNPILKVVKHCGSHCTTSDSRCISWYWAPVPAKKLWEGRGEQGADESFGLWQSPETRQSFELFV